MSDLTEEYPDDWIGITFEDLPEFTDALISDQVLIMRTFVTDGNETLVVARTLLSNVTALTDEAADRAEQAADAAENSADIASQAVITVNAGVSQTLINVTSAAGYAASAAASAAMATPITWVEPRQGETWLQHDFRCSIVANVNAGMSSSWINHDGSWQIEAAIFSYDNATEGLSVNTLNGGVTTFINGVGGKNLGVAGGGTIQPVAGALFAAGGGSLGSAGYLSEADAKFRGILRDVGYPDPDFAFLPSEDANFNAIAAAMSARVLATPMLITRPKLGKINHAIPFGESYQAAQTGYPAQTFPNTAILSPNVWMIGKSEHVAIPNSSIALPIDDNVFRQLVGNVLNLPAQNIAPRSVLSNAEVNLLNYGGGNAGESPLVSMMHWVALQLELDEKICVTNIGRSGAQIEYWLPGSQLYVNSPTGIYLFNRFASIMNAVKTAAIAAGYDYQVLGVFCDLGRNNQVAASVGAVADCWVFPETSKRYSVGDAATVATYLQQIHDGFETVRKSISNQIRKPLWAISQTDGDYTRDTIRTGGPDGIDSPSFLGVTEGIRSFVKNNPDNALMLGPDGHLPDRGHLHPFGNLQKGLTAAPKIARAWGLGMRSNGVEPFRLFQRDKQLRLLLAMDQAPVQNAASYWRLTSMLTKFLGCRVTNTAGTSNLAISSSYIVGNQVLGFDLADAPTDLVKLWLTPRGLSPGDFNTQELGGKWIKDSFPAMSGRNFVYTMPRETGTVADASCDDLGTTVTFTTTAPNTFAIGEGVNIEMNSNASMNVNITVTSRPDSVTVIGTPSAVIANAPKAGTGGIVVTGPLEPLSLLTPWVNNDGTGKPVSMQEHVHATCISAEYSAYGG